MTARPKRSRHARASLRLAAAALAVLALTAVHHVYGALAFGTPWRLHVAAIAVPAAIAIVWGLRRSMTLDGAPAGRRWAAFAALASLLVPVGAIGFYEGGYNHGLKNLVYFLGGETKARALFPPPLYEMPHDLFFEATGIAQFPLSIAAAIFAIGILRGTAR